MMHGLLSIKANWFVKDSPEVKGAQTSLYDFTLIVLLLGNWETSISH